jgi:hypothetical protein
MRLNEADRRKARNVPLGQGYVKVLDPSGILLLENIEAVEDTRWISPSIAR